MMVVSWIENRNTTTRKMALRRNGLFLVSCWTTSLCAISEGRRTVSVHYLQITTQTDLTQRACLIERIFQNLLGENKTSSPRQKGRFSKTQTLPKVGVVSGQSHEDKVVQTCAHMLSRNRIAEREPWMHWLYAVTSWFALVTSLFKTMREETDCLQKMPPLY